MQWQIQELAVGGDPPTCPHCPFLTILFPSFSAAKRSPWIQLRRRGQRCKLPSPLQARARPVAKRTLSMHFQKSKSTPFACGCCFTFFQLLITRSKYSHFHLLCSPWFSPLSKLADQARLYFACFNIFLSLIRAELLSQDLPDRFLQSPHSMKAFLVKFMDLNLFFQFLRGRCYGNQFWVKLAKWPSFGRLASKNG